VLKDDKVVGVAFQGMLQANSTGYVIPMPVIRHFLKDVEDGHYDGYVELGASFTSMENKAMRRHYGMPDNGLGCLVADVVKGSSCDGALQVGDVVVCHYPERGNTNFVKRVVGVPGDTITIVEGVVYRNGVAVEEPYLTPSRNRGSYYDITEPFVLGDDEYFVCGDNRDNSHDSRNYYTLGWGQYQPAAVTRDMIKGHVRWVVFPFGNARGIE
jgi:signal peptidase I